MSLNTYHAQPYEVVVRVERDRSEFVRRQEKRSSDDRVHAYRAFIYGTLEELRFPSVSTGDASEIAGLPLAAVESMSIDWGRYEEYAASFAVGEKLAEHMRHQLFRALSPGLEMLLDGHLQTAEPLRVWWDCRAPELNALPWELVAYRTGSRPARDVFVRGRPPEIPPPILPVGDTLRVAVIQDAAASSDIMTGALEGVPGIEVLLIPGEVREAIRTAVDRQVELLHFVCDAYQTRSQEGVLYFSHAKERHLPVSDLARLLHGSRITALGLTSYRSTNPDVMEYGGKKIPAVYQAFASLAASPLGLPSVVAALGPVEGGSQEVSRFWRRFYEDLASSLSLEQAMTHGFEGGPRLPMAMWLRHPQRRCFRRHELGGSYQIAEAVYRGAPPRLSNFESAEAIAPKGAEVAFDASQELIRKLEALQGLGNLPDSVTKFMKSEQQRQDRLNEALGPWLTEDEP